MSIFETLGELIGAAFRGLFSSISGLLKFKPEQLEDVNKEIAGESLDPEKFKTKEVKDLAKQIKKGLKHSPGGVAEWVQSIMGGFMTNVWEVALGIMIPEKMDTFEDAKAASTWLSFLFADFVVLVGVLDGVGTALTATLLRNLIHTFRLFAATFGMDRYMDACIAPALATSIVPMLTRGYNKQYKTYLPPTPDLITMMAHEAFEPAMIAKYGLHDEKEALLRDYFYEQGLDDDTIDAYWASHWVHASWGQVLDMYHRGVITYDDIWDWFRVVEMPPFWRDKLIEISWSLPNRIETRMMARYGLVNKEWLVEHLKRIGLHEDYRSIAADFMLAMGIRMDVSARFSKGWLTADEVRAEIAGFGMSADINDRLYKWIVKNVGPEKVEEERALTKTEIYAGVKKGVISWEQGLELLQDMGYSMDDAQYILEVRVGVLAGSPETYAEFKEWTQRYRKAQGLEAHIPPPELIEAGKVVRQAEIALRDAEMQNKVGEELAPYLKALSDAKYRYRALLVSWEEEKKKA